MTEIKKILLTGAAGFIGSHTSELLLSKGYKVIGIDNFDPYYPKSDKLKNLEKSLQHKNYTFHEIDICNEKSINEVLDKDLYAIIHLAAKAGVRNSITNPRAYFKTNVDGTINLLEFAKNNSISKFIFASSSSVYGINENVPWSESDKDLQPISPYASSKITGEALGHTYSSLYSIQFIGLRLFTVFGPRQRPDLAIHKFIHKMLKGESIEIYGDGSTSRDYTFIGDLVQGILGALEYNKSLFEIINLGSQQPYRLLDLISGIETVTGIKAKINFIGMQEGDVPKTFANIDKARKLLNYAPKTSLEEGLASFLKWKERL